MAAEIFIPGEGVVKYDDTITNIHKIEDSTTHEIKCAINSLEKGIEWIEPIRIKMGGVGRIKFVMNHALGVLKSLINNENT